MVAVGRARRRVDEARRRRRGRRPASSGSRRRWPRWSRAGRRASAAPSRARPGAARGRRRRRRARQVSAAQMSPSMKAKRAHCAGGDQRPHLVEVGAVAGGEVVEADHRPGRGAAAPRADCEPMKPATPVTSQRAGACAQTLRQRVKGLPDMDPRAATSASPPLRSPCGHRPT